MWTEEEKAAARAKAGAGKPEGEAEGKPEGKSPKPDGQPKQAAAKSSQPAKAETVAPAGGYSEAYSWVAVDLPVGSMEMPAVPVRASVAGSAHSGSGAWCFCFASFWGPELRVLEVPGPSTLNCGEFWRPELRIWDPDKPKYSENEAK